MIARFDWVVYYIYFDTKRNINKKSDTKIYGSHVVYFIMIYSITPSSSLFEIEDEMENE